MSGADEDGQGVTGRYQRCFQPYSVSDMLLNVRATLYTPQAAHSWTENTDPITVFLYSTGIRQTDQMAHSLNINFITW